MTSTDNQPTNTVIEDISVEKLIKDIIDEIQKNNPQKLKAIVEKNYEYTKVMEELKKDITTRIEELEKLKQKKIELLASL